MKRNTEVKREDGLVEIFNPTIDRIERGMMVRLKKGVGKKTYHPGFGCMEHDGVIIQDVDVKNQRVLVGCCIGGTKEHYDWFTPEQIKEVWSIGTYESSIEKIAGFNNEMKKVCK